MKIELRQGDNLKAIKDVYSDEGNLLFEEGTLYSITKLETLDGECIYVTDHREEGRHLDIEFVRENFRVAFYENHKPSLKDQIKTIEDTAEGMLYALKQLKDDHKIH